MKYDLEERTAEFGENLIVFLKKLLKDEINRRLISQCIRSGTSIGANYMEALHASSKKDFRNKIKICLKEANETKHWLRMITKANPDKKITCRELWEEAHQLVMIFAKSCSTCDKNKN